MKDIPFEIQSCGEDEPEEVEITEEEFLRV